MTGTAERTRPTTVVKSDRLAEALVAVGYLAGALWVFGRLWTGRNYLVDGGQDQYQWEWFFDVTARTHHLFGSTLQNHPKGVNLLANTSMPGLGVPLTPVTLLFGPTATWTVVLTFGLAATAWCWYRLLTRFAGRAGAALGGAFCAFAPPMISHANAHPNLAVLFVIPLIIIRLYEGGGVRLGLLAAWQVLLGEEALLLTGTGLVIYALARPSVIRPRLRTLAVAAAVASPLVAYPLWWQTHGPQSYRSLLHGPAGNDLAALPAFASRSLIGDPASAGALSFNPTEQNAFFGFPLLILVVVLVVWLRVWALGAVITGAAVLSLGPHVTLYGKDLGITGPWELVSRLPFYESVLETRVTMVCVPAIGILLALATDRAPVRLLWWAALAEALIPIAPLPLNAADRPPTPAFFTQGIWRTYAGPGRSIVTAPLPDGVDARALRWQVDAGLGFPLADGYFVGPYGTDRTGIYDAVPRPTSELFNRVRDKHQPVDVTDDDRRAVRADLAYWHAGAVVLGPVPDEATLHTTLERLLGPGTYVGGVWVWRAPNTDAPERVPNTAAPGRVPGGREVGACGRPMSRRTSST